MIYVLEDIFKKTKSENSERFNLRMQRSLSWLKKAVLMDEDKDLQFLSFWIAFNAIHAEDVESKSQQKLHIRQFLEMLDQQDDAQKIAQIIWEKLSVPIQTLLDNPYSFQDYWDYRNQVISQNTWKANFDNEKKFIQHVIEAKDLSEILAAILHRMYTVKQQILQGGYSYNSGVNRQLIHQCCEIWGVLIPTILELLIKNAKQWHFLKPHYPLIHVS